MLRQETDYGKISVGLNVYTLIAGNAATKCFGVKGMAMRSMKDGLVHLLRRESMSKGVSVRFNEDGSLTARSGKILSQTPMNRFGEPEELLGTLRFLIDNDAAGFITGVTIPVDGGFSAYSGV